MRPRRFPQCDATAATAAPPCDVSSNLTDWLRPWRLRGRRGAILRRIDPDVSQLPDSVNRDQRVGLLLITLSVVAFTAHSTHGFLLVDACLDAGGRYLSGPPRCDFGGAAT